MVQLHVRARNARSAIGRPWVLQAHERGSIPRRATSFLVAQLAEQAPVKGTAAGSRPAEGAACLRGPAGVGGDLISRRSRVRVPAQAHRPCSSMEEHRSYTPRTGFDTLRGHGDRGVPEVHARLWPWKARVRLPAITPSASWTAARPAGCNPAAALADLGRHQGRAPCPRSSSDESAGVRIRRWEVRLLSGVPPLAG